MKVPTRCADADAMHPDDRRTVGSERADGVARQHAGPGQRLQTHVQLGWGDFGRGSGAVYGTDTLKRGCIGVLAGEGRYEQVGKLYQMRVTRESSLQRSMMDDNDG